MKACLKFITPKEYAKLTDEQVKQVDIGTVIRILKIALRDKNMRYLVADILAKELGAEIRRSAQEYRVTCQVI